MRIRPAIFACVFLGLSDIGLAQGYFVFRNFSPGGEIDARVFDSLGNRLSGSNYLASLYVGPTADSLQPVITDPGSVVAIQPFLTGGFAGYIFPVNVRAENVVGGSFVWVEMRAWDARLGATYEEAQQLGLGGYGESSLFQTQSGRLTGVGVNYAPLTGLQSFSIREVIPEPSPMLLLLFGLPLLWLCARRSK